MTEFLGDIVDLAAGHPAVLAVVATVLAVVALGWAIVSSSYRYR